MLLLWDGGSCVRPEDHRDTLIPFVKELQKEFAREHAPADASGQTHRAAGRFALVGAAGEIASTFGVTGWPERAALQAAEACFKAGLQARGGAGDYEEMEMLRQARRFIELHGEGRFTDVDRSAEHDTHAPKTLQRSGAPTKKTKKPQPQIIWYCVRRSAPSFVLDSIGGQCNASSPSTAISYQNPKDTPATRDYRDWANSAVMLFDYRRNRRNNGDRSIAPPSSFG